ncbi:DNA starvation/stationary phase protection protein [Sandaracinobacter neustonicus]|uniref:DNA starvation/stationary phase protection protein n=1 Tax=Sandaracinobacter neustonicus TaxID=1715348 RepID=A0A501XHP7_9SPHN|nr:Dps family protein [Sandaracinobacter neustonicus]TPE59834.1 DNA starvation/stationary phase protection protein [Sandaracinobacter neustonicus]
MATKTEKKAAPKKPKKAAVPGPAALDIGIPADQLGAITNGLSRLLADTYTLYLKTHNYHWNVTGPQFNSLHLMFEAQYTELALAVDVIAERLRALGAWAPGSYSDFARLSTVKEASGIPAAEAMVAELAADQATVVRTARALFPAVDAAGDEPTADLLTQRMQVHEKTAWMLRALIA